MSNTEHTFETCICSPGETLDRKLSCPACGPRAQESFQRLNDHVVEMGRWMHNSPKKGKKKRQKAKKVRRDNLQLQLLLWEIQNLPEVPDYPDAA